MGLPGIHHYLGYLDGEPVATFSLICHQRLGILGSAGVVPAHRRKGIISDLAIEATQTARQQGVERLLLQTTVGFLLEKLLNFYGFKKVFTRVSYSLS